MSVTKHEDGVYSKSWQTGNNWNLLRIKFGEPAEEIEVVVLSDDEYPPTEGLHADDVVSLARNGVERANREFGRDLKIQRLAFADFDSLSSKAIYERLAYDIACAAIDA